MSQSSALEINSTFWLMSFFSHARKNLDDFISFKKGIRPLHFLTWLFDYSRFPPRWRCGPGWQEAPWLGWLHIFSDLGVWSANIAIPCVLMAAWK